MSVDWHTSPSWVSLDTFPQDATIHKRMMVNVSKSLHIILAHYYRLPLIPTRSYIDRGPLFPYNNISPYYTLNTIEQVENRVGMVNNMVDILPKRSIISPLSRPLQ